MNNSGNTFVQDITLDTYGHITNINSASVSSIPIVTSDTPPGDPSDGTLWWDSASGVLYVYYTDADSSQWVPATPALQGADGADGADATFTVLTQAQYDDLSPPTAGVLYLIEE